MINKAWAGMQKEGRLSNANQMTVRPGKELTHSLHTTIQNTATNVSKQTVRAMSLLRSYSSARRARKWCLSLGFFTKTQLMSASFVTIQQKFVILTK